jgi:hypothetical protein
MLRQQQGLAFRAAKFERLENNDDTFPFKVRRLASPVLASYL